MIRRSSNVISYLVRIWFSGTATYFHSITVSVIWLMYVRINYVYLSKLHKFLCGKVLRCSSFVLLITSPVTQ